MSNIPQGPGPSDPNGGPPPGGYSGGQPMGQGPYGGEQKSKMVAGILGILLGGIGAHWFYLGDNNKAIIRLVVTIVTCGFGSIWGLIEGIMILMGSDGYTTDANGVPLKD